MSREFWREYWDRKRAVHALTKDLGLVCVTKRGSRLVVSSLVNPLFIEGARLLYGSWRTRTKTWTFSVAVQSELLALCGRVYGAEKVTRVGF